MTHPIKDSLQALQSYFQYSNKIINHSTGLAQQVAEEVALLEGIQLALPDGISPSERKKLEDFLKTHPALFQLFPDLKNLLKLPAASRGESSKGMEVISRFASLPRHKRLGLRCAILFTSETNRESLLSKIRKDTAEKQGHSVLERMKREIAQFEKYPHRFKSLKVEFPPEFYSSQIPTDARALEALVRHALEQQLKYKAAFVAYSQKKANLQEADKLLQVYQAADYWSTYVQTLCHYIPGRRGNFIQLGENIYETLVRPIFLISDSYSNKLLHGLKKVFETLQSHHPSIVKEPTDTEVQNTTWKKYSHLSRATQYKLQYRWFKTNEEPYLINLGGLISDQTQRLAYAQLRQQLGQLRDQFYDHATALFPKTKPSLEELKSTRLDFTAVQSNKPEIPLSQNDFQALLHAPVETVRQQALWVLWGNYEALEAIPEKDRIVSWNEIKRMKQLIQENNLRLKEILALERKITGLVGDQKTFAQRAVESTGMFATWSESKRFTQNNLQLANLFLKRENQTLEGLQSRTASSASPQLAIVPWNLEPLVQMESTQKTPLVPNSANQAILNVAHILEKGAHLMIHKNARLSNRKIFRENQVTIYDWYRTNQKTNQRVYLGRGATDLAALEGKPNGSHMKFIYSWGQGPGRKFPEGTLFMHLKPGPLDRHTCSLIAHEGGGHWLTDLAGGRLIGSNEETLSTAAELRSYWACGHTTEKSSGKLQPILGKALEDWRKAIKGIIWAKLREDPDPDFKKIAADLRAELKAGGVPDIYANLVTEGFIANQHHFGSIDQPYSDKYLTGNIAAKHVMALSDTAYVQLLGYIIQFAPFDKNSMKRYQWASEQLKRTRNIQFDFSDMNQVLQNVYQRALAE